MTELERLQQQHARLTSELDAAEASLRDLRQRKNRAKKALDEELRRVETEGNFGKLIEAGWDRRTIELIRLAHNRASEVKKLRESNRSKVQAYNQLRWFLHTGQINDWESEYDTVRQQYAHLDRAKTLLEGDSYSDTRAQWVKELIEKRHELWLQF